MGIMGGVQWPEFTAVDLSRILKVPDLPSTFIGDEKHDAAVLLRKNTPFKSMIARIHLCIHCDAYYLVFQCTSKQIVHKKDISTVFIMITAATRLLQRKCGELLLN